MADPHLDPVEQKSYGVDENEYIVIHVPSGIGHSASPPFFRPTNDAAIRHTRDLPQRRRVVNISQDHGRKCPAHA